MEAPENGEQTPEFIKKRKRFPKRLFHWGIAFLIVSWIYAAITEVSVDVNFKGKGRLTLMVGYGSIGFGSDTHIMSAGNSIVLNKPKFLWDSSFRKLKQSPMSSLLGRTVVDFSNQVVLFLPLSGFLWIWLLGGWMHRFKKWSWAEFRKDRPNIGRATILISLPLLILLAEQDARRASDMSACIMNIRNIQQAIRGHEGMNQLDTGDLIPWNEIIGPGKYIPAEYKKCRRGGDYRLKAHIPEIGVLAAECRDPEHQKRIKKTDTSGW